MLWINFLNHLLGYLFKSMKDTETVPLFKILNKQILARDIKRLDIYAPLIAKKALPGQFVSISPEEGDGAYSTDGCGYGST